MPSNPHVVVNSKIEHKFSNKPIILAGDEEIPEGVKSPFVVIRMLDR
jgi:hypothetical protein